MAERPNRSTAAQNADRMRMGWIVLATGPNVVQQTGELNCGPACAEMLLADRGVTVSQAAIAKGLRLPTNGTHLAESMNRAFPGLRWTGGSIDEAATFEVVGSIGSRGTWAALLEPGGPHHIGHWVVVDGVDWGTRVVNVRDPIGSAYAVPAEVFTAL